MAASNTRAKTRVALLGCGRIGRYHAEAMLATEGTEIVVVSEPSGDAYASFCALYEDVQQAVDGVLPPNEPDLEKLLTRYGDQLDVVLIATPHAFHHEQTTVCLESGLDVLLEKPMVVTVAEAESLIRTRDRSGKLLVVAFTGSLSARIRAAASLLRRGELGEMLSIAGMTWEFWRTPNLGTWRQQPEISGGGFFFDTGAHMLNTISDLAGEEFVEVAAWLDRRSMSVEIVGVAMARLASGTLVTFHACGDAGARARSQIHVFCTGGVLETGIWGERLAIQRVGNDHFEEVPVPPRMSVWQQFLDVRAGVLENPCPPEIGLRMARLWDAIQGSAAQGGVPVPVQRASVK